MPKVRYQPLGPLLSGKGSRAFLALEIPEDAPRQARPVVLVWLPDELARDKDAVAAVERETQRAVVLEHPNIIRVFGLTREKEGVARVVEFADAESLRRVLEVAKKLPVGLAARITVDAAMGVHYAHLAGNDDGTPMVHGDIRPETVLVSYGGITKVSGYGALAVAPREPGGRRVRGRRQHCAPEQVVGGRDAINVQTDVYLLGVMLYECITGRIPFEDAPNFDEAVLSAPVPPLSDELCPPALAQVIQRAMAKKATERYASALALREAIEQALSNELSTPAAVAHYLRDFFPEMTPARTARQQMLDAAVTELGGIEPPPPPVDALTSPSSPQGYAAITPSPSAPTPPAPVAPAPASAAPAEASDSTRLPAPAGVPRTTEPARRSRAPFVVIVLLLLLIPAAVVLAMFRMGHPLGGLMLPATLAPDAGGPVGLAPDAGGLPALALAVDGGTPDGGTLGGTDAGMPDGGTDGGQTTGDGGTAVASAGAPDAGDAGFEGPGLTLFVEPSVDVTDATFDNRPLGHTPFTIPMTPGRHVLKLINTSRAINTSRVVNIPDAGVDNESVYLAKGYVAITAPDGAEIFIDGRSYGTAPQRDIGVYEGNHKVVVTVGQARWQETFDIRPHERLKFDVDFQE